MVEIIKNKQKVDANEQIMFFDNKFDAVSKIYWLLIKNNQCDDLEHIDSLITKLHHELRRNFIFIKHTELDIKRLEMSQRSKNSDTTKFQMERLVQNNNDSFTFWIDLLDPIGLKTIRLFSKVSPGGYNRICI